MDVTTLLGLLIGLGGIIGGMILEGGHISSILQLTAAVIVFGGTMGAVLVSTTQEDLKTGISLLKWAFGNPKGDDRDRVMFELIEAAQIARKDSILALEPKLGGFSSPFMQNVFRLVIDGVEPNTLRDIYETEMALEEENLMAGAKVWVDAGSYAPTIGIIGAVLGLIHVMSNLTDTSKLGAGIAVAFVATVYGVASANILFLPLGSKLKRKIRMQLDVKAMVIEGAVGIMNGLNPFIIEEKLRAFNHNGKNGKQSAGAA